MLGLDPGLLVPNGISHSYKWIWYIEVNSHCVQFPLFDMKSRKYYDYWEKASLGLCWPWSKPSSLNSFWLILLKLLSKETIPTPLWNLLQAARPEISQLSSNSSQGWQVCERNFWWKRMVELYGIPPLRVSEIFERTQQWLPKEREWGAVEAICSGCRK